MAFGVIIYEREHESFLDMTDEEAGKIVKNMIRAFRGEEPEELKGFMGRYARSLCLRVIEDRDKAVEGSINGKKGGAPKGNQNAKKNNPKQPTLVLETTVPCLENKANNNNNNNINNNNNNKTKKNNFTNNCIKSDIDFEELENKVVKNQ